MEVVRSHWFFERVRARLVSTVETATGGRVEIGSFGFDWHLLRAEVRDFTLHGTEPAGAEPLLHAESAAVGSKIISLVKRRVDIAYLEVTAPRIHLIIDRQGRTNIPAPKNSTPGKPAVADDSRSGDRPVFAGARRIHRDGGGKTPFFGARRRL